MDNVDKLIELCSFVVDVADKDIDPALKYDLIFCKEVSVQIFNQVDLYGLYGYCDPDTTYEADVDAFANAVRQLLADLKKVKGG